MEPQQDKIGKLQTNQWNALLMVFVSIVVIAIISYFLWWSDQVQNKQEGFVLAIMYAVLGGFFFWDWVRSYLESRRLRAASKSNQPS